MNVVVLFLERREGLKRRCAVGQGVIFDGEKVCLWSVNKGDSRSFKYSLCDCMVRDILPRREALCTDELHLCVVSWFLGYQRKPLRRLLWFLFSSGWSCF